MSDKTVRAHFHSQADACDRLGSPFTARLCRLLGERLEFSTKTGSKVLGWPGNLRLAGGLHAMVLQRENVELAGVYSLDRRARYVHHTPQGAQHRPSSGF